MPHSTHNAPGSASSSVDSTTASTNTDPKPTPRAGFFGDARIHNGFDPNDSLFDREQIFTFGARKESKNWKPANGTLRDALTLLSAHNVGQKNGPAFICGEMAPGPRNKNAVKKITAIGLDVDVGTPFTRIAARLDTLGCVALMYTTHGHLKTLSEFRRDKIVKFAGEREITDELIREFLREVERYERSIVVGAEYVGQVHRSEGIMVQVSHPPLPKHRIFVPLAEPFIIADEGRTQRDAHDKWAKVLRAFAALIDVPLDEACLDVSRLLYMPRHAEGAEFESGIWGGSLFDWRTVETDSALDRIAAETGTGRSKSVTPEGKALGKWWTQKARGFQIADVIADHCDEFKRGSGNDKFNICCPFDEDHSNAGDTSDTACFVVNATSGTTEYFAIKCQHESCKDKTSLDMLGKMIADGWFDAEVLDDERYNAAVVEDAPKPEAESAKSEAGEESTRCGKLTVGDIRAAIVKLGERPDADAVEAVLNLIAAEPDAAARDKLFVTAEAALVGANRKLVMPVKKRANADWKEKNKPRIEKANSKLPLPVWGNSYGKFNGRAFVYGLADDGEPTPLHSPLHLASAVTYPDRMVQGREITRGIRIEFENETNESRVLTFTRSQALSAPKEGMIADLSDAGVALTPQGIDAVKNGILASGLSPQGGAVYDFPGWREDDVFLTPGDEVISNTRRRIWLAEPLSGIARAGSPQAWRGGIAAAFSDEMLQKAPHLPATILWGFVSPLIDRADEEMSLLLSAAGRTTRLKTFSLRAMASVWGECDKPTTRGLLASFSATPNALERFAIQRSGCGLAIDESKLIPGEVLGTFVYRIVTGAERARLNERVRQWSIATAITSETPIAQAILASGAEVAPGLMSRILEINTTGVRVSDTPVEAIKTAFDNYGHAGPEFVRTMLREGWTRERIIADVQERVAVLNGGTGEQEQERRASRAVAYISLAATIAKQAGLVPAEFESDTFAAAIWDQARGAADTTRSVVARVYGALAAGVRNGTIPIYSRHGDALTTTGDGAICLQHHGKFKEPVFALTSATLARIIGSGETVKDAVKILDEDGAIYRERTDRLFTRGDRIGLGNVTCYLIYARSALGEGAEDMIEEHRAARVGAGTQKTSISREAK